MVEAPLLGRISQLVNGLVLGPYAGLVVCHSMTFVLQLVLGRYCNFPIWSFLTLSDRLLSTIEAAQTFCSFKRMTFTLTTTISFYFKNMFEFVSSGKGDEEEEPVMENDR